MIAGQNLGMMSRTYLRCSGNISTYCYKLKRETTMLCLISNVLTIIPFISFITLSLNHNKFSPSTMFATGDGISSINLGVVIVQVRYTALPLVSLFFFGEISPYEL